MTFFPTKFAKAMLPLVLFCLITSCANDTDFLVDAVLNDPTKDIEKSISNEASETESEENTSETEEDLVSKTFTFNSVNDAYIQDDQGYDGTLMRLQEGRRTSYLMFDLSNLEGNITSAILQFTIDSDGGSGTIRVNKGRSSEWSEDDLTASNAPETDIELASTNKTYSTGSIQKIELSASDLISETLTIILTHEAGNDLAFASKEHPAGIGPQLIVTYLTSPDAQDPMSSTEEEVQNSNNSDNSNSDQQANHSVDVDFYVTPNGNATNDGLTEGTAWSLEYAFANAKAGDNVYVKAGNYGNVEVTAENTGSPGNEIRFIGYKNVPGDIISTTAPTFTYEDYKNGINTNSPAMPLLQGNRSNSEGSGTAIRVDNEDHIVIENFMLRHFEYGIFLRGDNNVLRNVVSIDHGDFNPAHSYPNGTSDLHANLTGNGFWITGSDNVKIENCLAINNGARGIAIISSSGVTSRNNEVYSDSETNPTDYYFMLYNSHDNYFENNAVHRIGALSHPGHGYSIKVDSSNNVFENCSAYGTSFELNNRVHHNTFRNCHVQGTGKALSGGWEITNYSHDNEFINCSNDSGEGIVFSDWKENDGDNGLNTAAFNNTFRNCTITNVVDHSGAIIDFHWNNQGARLTSYARDNTFIDCHFSGAKSLFKIDRVNKGNQFINCKISNIEELRHSRYDINKTIQLDVTIDNPILENVGFSL